MDKDHIKLACEMVSRGLGNLTCDGKRLAIEALDIKVWIKHDELIMEGSIPMPDDLSNLTVTSRCFVLERHNPGNVIRSEHGLDISGCRMSSPCAVHHKIQASVSP